MKMTAIVSEQQRRFRGTLRHLLWVAAPTTLLAMSTMLFGQRIGVVTVPINPQASYILTNAETASVDAIPISLESLGLRNGDYIRLTTVGDLSLSVGVQPETRRPACGVFSSTSTLLPPSDPNRVPGAMKARGLGVVSCTTPPTLFGSIPTDIPQDFVLNGAIVRVPPGARWLFVAAADTYYSDNADPNHDYALRIQGVSLEASLLDSHVAFIENQNGDSISVLDTLSNTVVNTIPLVSDPTGAAFPGSDKAYVSLNGANSIAVINPGTDKVIGNIPVGSAPVGIAVNPRKPYAYVANNYSNSVSVIDTASDTLVNSLAVGSVPTEIAVSPDGTRAVVTNQYGGTVTVLDTSTNTVLTTVPVGSTPVGVAFTPDSKFAWITLATTDQIAVLNLSTESVGSYIPAGPGPIRVAFSPDGSYALTSDFYSDTVTIIDASTDAVRGTIVVGSNPVGIAFDPTGVLAYVVNYGSDSVSVIDTGSMAVIGTVPAGANPVEIAIRPRRAFNGFSGAS